MFEEKVEMEIGNYGRRSGKDPRVILYAHDGSGFGHLKRISRLASSLQRNCTCLVITGAREASWLIDRSCEFIKLPSWENMFRPRSTNLTGKLWLDLSKNETVRFRSDLIREITKVFDPDAFVVDYLPYGLRNELFNTLLEVRARKYLLFRGIIDSSDYELREILQSTEIGQIYDRFLIAADRRIIDPLDDLPFNPKAMAKCEWIGYMTDEYENFNRLSSGSVNINEKLWVVCSAGSGLKGEPLFSECIKLAREYPSIVFDLVVGTRCALETFDTDTLPENLRLSGKRPDLPELHASADIVITSGGYNSLIEATLGGAEIIVCPVNKGLKDEQFKQARQFQRFYPLTIAEETNDLSLFLRNAIVNRINGRNLKLPLEVNGTYIAKHIICNDLGVRINDEVPDENDRKLFHKVNGA